MAEQDRAEKRRQSMREVIGMFEDASRGEDAWRQTIAIRLQRGSDDPSQQVEIVQELLDLINGAVTAGAWLGGLARTLSPEAEWTGDGQPPPDFPGQPDWPWTLLRDMTSTMPD
jgi:hypothetical protein